MPLFEVTKDESGQLDMLVKVPETAFAKEGIFERQNLQPLLAKHLEFISPRSMLLAESYSSWDASKREIDLLALDADGTLVVIEVKRTDDAGHADLQALRYAAMISSMTLAHAISARNEYNRRHGTEEDADEIVRSFLSDPESGFGADVRIILVSAEFSNELITSTNWLYEHGIDMACVRVKPFKLNETWLLDIQTIYPQPEIADRLIRVREKQQIERNSRAVSRDYTRYDVTIDGVVKPSLTKRSTALALVTAFCDQGVSPQEILGALENKQLFLSQAGDLDEEKFKASLRGTVDDEKFERYFTDTSQLIKFDGHTYALSNQWGGDMVADVFAKLRSIKELEGVECTPVSATN